MQRIFTRDLILVLDHFPQSTVILMGNVVKNRKLLEIIPCFSSNFRSGAGYASLNQRTVAQYLTLLNEVARGRYGCVQQAYYRTRLVAVKTFYTSEEESWRNEKDIYLTQMLNHENILRKLPLTFAAWILLPKCY